MSSIVHPQKVISFPRTSAAPRPRKIGTSILLFLMLLTGCRGELKQTGGAWEVIVVTDNDSIAQVAKDSLGMADTLLPQPEPMLDVKIEKQSNPLTRRHRNMVDLTGVTSPDWTKIRSQIINKERERTRQYLAKHHNKDAGKVVKETFGIDILVPEEMTKMKRGENFIWLSSGTATGMTNLCIYLLPNDEEIDEQTFKEKRDSVMKCNMPGEKDGMYMTTGSAHRTEGMYRGLWEMKDDMMGGPYSATITRTGQGLLVKEVFVYAPEGKKRNLIRRIEGALE